MAPPARADVIRLVCLVAATAMLILTPAASAETDELSGYASWYGGKFHGRQTASGEIFDTNSLTAAHRTLPFDSIVRVTNTENGKEVIVRINDRGPFVDGRVIDLSRAAADVLGITAVGIAPVTLEVLHRQNQTQLRTIQVAAFSRRANADELVEELRAQGIPAIIESAGEGVNRVIVQGVPVDEIPGYRTRLAEIGYRRILIRQK